ncbi:MAG: Eco57I restriction-modification methylase domain-containing protein [Jatrophihabitantaceae bacterium]
MAVASHDQLALPDVTPQYRSFEIADDGEHGEVFTRRWVVEHILDLVGYTSDRPLHERTLVEPSCGSGAFLGIIAERLSASCKLHGVGLAAAAPAVRAHDLLERNVVAARATLVRVLTAHGWPSATVDTVVESWINRADFLLTWHEPESVDYVVGNPPYIRLEDVPAERNEAYRRAWPTMAGRSDIYVGFIEKGLQLLRTDGRLGFICADRWMRNQYGAPLRELVTARYSVEAVVSMHDVDAFDRAVSAYPAVTVLANHAQGEAIVVDTNAGFGEASARKLMAFASSSRKSATDTAFKAAKLPHWFGGRESWPQGSPDRLKLLEYLSDNFPSLEDPTTGTRVGIGVATGADQVYVVPEEINIEPDRLLPMSMVKDISSGNFEWSGHYLVSPWCETGLVDLTRYPKLAAYFDSQEPALRKRHVATKRPATWFRTIDRVDPTLTTRPKLLIQDMRLSIHPVLDKGTAYPHHNLYYVVSDGWDIKVLGGLLLSDVANAFIEAYAVKMRGGTLRFQAQYLRRIRVPQLAEVSESDQRQLADAFERRDRNLATTVTLRLFGLAELPA